MEEVNQRFPDSFGKLGSMPGAYNITLDPNIPAVQHRRHRVLVEAKEGIKVQLKEMTTYDIITPQVEPMPCISILTHPCKSDGTWECPST